MLPKWYGPSSCRVGNSTPWRFRDCQEWKRGSQPRTAVMMEAMNANPEDVGAEIEAYAAYLNAPRGILDSDEQVLFDQDLLKARAAMERAWLEAKPVRERP
jgi:hypothetical protein